MKKPLCRTKIYKTTVHFALFAILLTSETSQSFGNEKRIPVWEAGTPNAKGDTKYDKPEMIYYPAEAKTANGAAVIIFPGGGYAALAIDHEGAQVARWLNSFGVTAFVLKYRLTKHGYTPKDAFMDAQMAIRRVRHNAKKYNIDGNRLGVLGFSAGGNLATTVSLNHDNGNPRAEYAVNNHSSRPDFSLLIYPAYIVDARRNDLVELRDPDKNTPPAFIAVTGQDRFYTSSLELLSRYRKAKVDAELHVFGGWGPHGLGLAPSVPGFGNWPDLAKNWIRSQGLLTTAKKAESVDGQVTIDGEPLARGFIRFVPKGDDNKPIRSAYIARSKGRFSLDQQRALCVGEYTVEIHQLATGFLDDPSIPDAKVFGAKGELSVNVASDQNTFQFDLKSR